MATNRANGKVYIGQTRQAFSRRKSRHLWDAARNNPCRFHAAIRKYGPEAFEFKTLVVGPAGDWLSEMEIRAIEAYDSYNKGYNDTKGGEGTLGSKARLGKTHTPEARAKIGAARRGKPGTRLGHHNTPEQNEKVRQANLGKILSAEHRAAISAGQKGRLAWNKGATHTEATKRKMSLSHTGAKRPASVGEKTRARLLGTHLSEETKRKISEARKRYCAEMKGSK
jgi:group I intron endonuclease